MAYDLHAMKTNFKNNKN